MMGGVVGVGGERSRHRDELWIEDVIVRWRCRRFCESYFVIWEV